MIRPTPRSTPFRVTPPANDEVMVGSGLKTSPTGSSTHSVNYQLFRSTTPGFTPSSANLVTTTSATGYFDTGLTEATSYYYVVEATNTFGSSQPSNQATAQTGGAGSITAVSGSGQTAHVGAPF